METGRAGAPAGHGARLRAARGDPCGSSNGTGHEICIPAQCDRQYSAGADPDFVCPADPSVDEAMRRGCNKNIVIITRELGYHKDKEQGAGLAGAMLHKYPAFRRLLLTRAERYNVSHRAVVKMAEEGKLFLIAPEDTIGWKRTDKEPERLKMMYDCGVARAEAALPALKRYLTEGESM